MTLLLFLGLNYCLIKNTNHHVLHWKYYILSSDQPFWFLTFALMIKGLLCSTFKSFVGSCFATNPKMILINVDQCIIRDIMLAVGIKLKKINYPSGDLSLLIFFDFLLPEFSYFIFSPLNKFCSASIWSFFVYWIFCQPSFLCYVETLALIKHSSANKCASLNLRSLFEKWAVLTTQELMFMKFREPLSIGLKACNITEDKSPDFFFVSDAHVHKMSASMSGVWTAFERPLNGVWAAFERRLSGVWAAFERRLSGIWAAFYHCLSGV